MYPGAYFILSCWYLPHELQTRMGIFYGANTLAGAFGVRLCTLMMAPI